jgi:transposase
MTMSCDGAGTKPVRFEVFTDAGRRREWADEIRAWILAESYAGLESVSAVARRHGLCHCNCSPGGGRRATRNAMEAAHRCSCPLSSSRLRSPLFQCDRSDHVLMVWSSWRSTVSR